MTPCFRCRHPLPDDGKACLTCHPNSAPLPGQIYDLHWKQPVMKTATAKRPCKRHRWETAESYDGRMVQRCVRCKTEEG